MFCEYCHRYGQHHPQCPNYIPTKSTIYCSICNEGICDGEEYIENDIGEYAHWYCINGERELLDWLGYKIKTKENTDERDY